MNTSKKVGVLLLATLAALVLVIVLSAAAKGRQDSRVSRAVAGARFSFELRKCCWKTGRQASRVSRVVDGVRFSFELPKCCWETGPHRKHGKPRNEKLLITESSYGSQGAEAVVFWTSFPGHVRTNMCSTLGRRIGPSALSLAASLARAPGTKLVRGPVRVIVGGRAAQHVVLTVRKDVGCDPGFFYGWPHGECLGACWLVSSAGDTISVWIVAVGGTRLFIEAETSGVTASTLRDIRRIVASIRFD